MILDAHTNILPPSVRQLPFVDLLDEPAIAKAFPIDSSQDVLKKACAETLIASMNQAGIDRSIAFGFAWANHQRCIENNDYVIEAVQTYAERLLGFCVVQPLSGHAALREVDRCLSQGLVGVQLKPSWQGYNLDAFEVTGELLRYLEMHQIPLLVHVTQPYKQPQGDHPHQIFAVAAAFPKLRLILEHLGGALFLYHLYPPLHPVMQNLVFLTSVPRTMSMVQLAAEILPSGQLVFGSDFPFNDHQDQLTMLNAMRHLIDDPEKLKAILGGNCLLERI